MKIHKQEVPETLGGRMKGYEKDYGFSIPNEHHMIIRIDGHHFSKFTKTFIKPFDPVLSKAMELTTHDLVDRFDAVLGYTQSDEISLIIPTLLIPKVDLVLKNPSNLYNEKRRESWTHIFSGRVQKIVSLIAAYTTLRFNYHLRKYANEEIFYTLHDGVPYFDARCYGVPTNEEAFNSILWRARDAEKNSRSMFAQAYCSHKSLLNKTGEEQVQFCLETTGKDWNKEQDIFKYGILIKKEVYQKVISLDESVTRTRIISFAKHLTYSEENVNLIMSNYI